MILFFLKTRVRNTITILGLSTILVFYTFFMSNKIYSSEDTITVYFLMMLFWFIMILILAMVTAVLVGDLFFKDPFWKKEEILLLKLTDQEYLIRKDFKEYKYRFRIIIVLLVGMNIFILNKLSNGVFDFYNAVGLQLSQLNYDDAEKQKGAIKELYNRKNVENYQKLVFKRVKKMIETSKYDEAKVWGMWYIKKKGTIKDIEYFKTLIKGDSPLIVAEAASAIFELVVDDAERVAKAKYKDGDDLKFLIEKEKIKRKVFSEDFEYKELIESACNRVGYPRDCLLTVATFDGRESLKVIKSKISDPKSYIYAIWVLANSIPSEPNARKEVENILMKFYKNGTLETKCLLTIAFSRLKSLDAQQLMIDDFIKNDRVKCPRIEQDNKAEDPYVLSNVEYFQIKILNSIDLIEDLRIETRKFLYSLTENKKLHLKVRSRAIKVYDRLEKKYRDSIKK